MKVAKEKVWADSKGNLVPDGHEDAQTLVAGKGANIPDAQIEQYKGADKFFEDAVFDNNGQQVVKQERAKPAQPFSYNMVTDHGKAAPQPQNREAEMQPNQRAADAPKPAVKSAAKKTAAKKSGK